MILLEVRGGLGRGGGREEGDWCGGGRDTPSEAGY